MTTFDFQDGNGPVPAHKHHESIAIVNALYTINEVRNK